MKVANVVLESKNKSEQYEPSINYLESESKRLNIKNDFQIKVDATSLLQLFEDLNNIMNDVNPGWN